jgi:hypothetical protein
LTSYAAAIRWGRFESAADFMAPSPRPPALDSAWLKNIHVTSYEVLYRKNLEKGSLIEQNVEIRYYHEQSGVEKTLLDRQRWRYQEKQNTWALESGLPAFR